MKVEQQAAASFDYDDDEIRESKALSIVENLTLDDKISLLSGKSMWTLNGVQVKIDDEEISLPSIYVSDGPHGVRKAIHETTALESHSATCFPTSCTLACSWDKSLLKEVGIALSNECQYQNVSVLLGPGMNIKRHPCGGRNFEYFSEDPYLCGTLASHMVQGIQYNNRVGACIKHFCVNNQETVRFRINSIVDERALREVYLKAFEQVVKQQPKQQPWTIMCAYNKLNGVYCSENPLLFQDILRKEWNYKGLIMTDWGAINDRVASINAGIHLEMPGSYGAHNKIIKRALESGELDKTRFNEAVAKNVSLIMKGTATALSNTSGENEEQEQEERTLRDNHHKLAHRAALESIVLLKNEANILPLKENSSIALIGDFCKYPRYQGQGSSNVKSYKVDLLIDEINRYTKTVQFARGYRHDSDGDGELDNTNNTDIYVQVANSDDCNYEDNHIKDSLVKEEKKRLQSQQEAESSLSDEQLTDIKEAVDIARHAEVAVIVAGLPPIYESEGYDRKNLELPKNHNFLIEKVCEVNSNVVVLLCCGGPVTMPWKEAPKGIFQGHLLGQAGASAFADILFGSNSPCGKLAETFPIQLQDVPSNLNFPGKDMYNVEYREGLNIGYRYFDTYNIPVLFPFGHGLSYTTFSYSDLSLATINSKNKIEGETSTGQPECEDVDTIEVQFQLTNIGKFPGAEILQCYVHYDDNVSMVYHPEQELKEFTKVYLQPGESQIVTFGLNILEALSFYDSGLSDWIVENGQYEIRIGASSRDIRLKKTIQITTGTTQPSNFACETYPPLRIEKKKRLEIVGSSFEQSKKLQDHRHFGVADDVTFSCRMGGQDKLIKSTEQHNLSVRANMNDTVEYGDDDKLTPFHRNTLLKEIKTKNLGKVVAYFVLKGTSMEVKADSKSIGEKKMIEETVLNVPLRCLVLFSRGNLSFDTLDTLINLLNGQYCLASVNTVTSLFSKIKVFFGFQVR